jgi:hypothetical protein
MKTKDKVYAGLLIGFFLAFVAFIGSEMTDKTWPIPIAALAFFTFIAARIGFAELRSDE